MNRKSWTALILAVLMLLTAVAASADVWPLKKGSRGDEVEDVQWMLYDLGFLKDNPDGIFGRKTQAAVKAWQKYRGEKQTGKMTEEEMLALTDIWSLVEDIATEANAPEEELIELYGTGCSFSEDEGGTLRYDYCYRHYQIRGLYDLLKTDGAPSKMENKVAERLQALCLKYIGAMYDEWEQSLPDSDQHIVREQRAGFESALAEKRTEWASGKSPLKEEALWLNETAVNLCFDLHTAEGNTP